MRTDAKTVVVLSSATRFSGAYMIYRQFINHLASHVTGYKYYIFIDPKMYQPKIEGVEYIYEYEHSWPRRIYMDIIGWKNFLKRRQIKPNLIISLQNTGMVTKLPQLLYYHNPLAFFANKWNPFVKAERSMFLYKYIYPFFVKLTMSPKTDVVVQIPFMKEKFIKKYKWPKERVHVMFPDMENIDVSVLKSDLFPKNEYHFVYPAAAYPYKKHITIAKAIKLLIENSKYIGENVRVHFTVLSKELPDVEHYVCENGLEKQIIFHDGISHGKLLEVYNSCRGLLFPSTIETFGLPLIEAAKVGIPIIASDLDYAREVLDGYKGATFVPSEDPIKWATSMKELCLNNKRFEAIHDEPSSWMEFYKVAYSLIE